MTVDAWWRGVCVERVVIAAVISQGSKHIPLHDCYLCKKTKKNKVQLKVWSQNSNKLSVSLPVLFVSGAAPGFVSQITTLVFQFLKRVAQVYFWIFFLRKIMNNQEALEKKTSVSGFSFFFFAPRTICDTEQMSGLCMQMLNCCYITDDGNQRGNTFQRWFQTTASSSAPMVFKRQRVLYTGAKSTVKPFHCKSESPPARIFTFSDKANQIGRWHCTLFIIHISDTPLEQKCLIRQVRTWLMASRFPDLSYLTRSYQAAGADVPQLSRMHPCIWACVCACVCVQSAQR